MSLSRTPLVASLLLLAGSLAGCDLLPSWLGESESDPPLPGQRVSILTLDRGLTADRAIADLPVSLPQPFLNESWTQAGGTPAHVMYHLQLKDSVETLWRSDVGRGASHRTRA